MAPVAYKSRRDILSQKVQGVILLLGNTLIGRNYGSNTYPFRQDSNFLYFTGISRPDLAIVIIPGQEHILYGDDYELKDIVWQGPLESLQSLSISSGLDRICSLKDLKADLLQYFKKFGSIHYLPPYQAQRTIKISDLLEIPAKKGFSSASKTLVESVISMRSYKSKEEVAQIESSIEISKKMYNKALKSIKPGILERQVMAQMEAVALSNGAVSGFAPIVTVEGQVLHNNRYDRELKKGQLLLIDTGIEIPPDFYCSDITRTYPVSGKFSAQQKDCYEIVLESQKQAIKTIKPGISNIEVHKKAAVTIVEGLKTIGLMKGDSNDAVIEGAYALFFPHGIGHMLGLDAHDMEDLGDLVGYPEGQKKSKSPGLCNLRMGRILEPGFVVTIEPGLYFIEPLIEQWKKKKKHINFINYEKINNFKGFGGIRIEDDVLVTHCGSRVLGPYIEKEIHEIEACLMSDKVK